MEDWQDRFLNTTWDELRQLAFDLSLRVGRSPLKFDLIIAIARGGLTIAQLLSDHLQLPIATFTVESYKDLKQTKLPHIVYGLSASLTNKKILLVDDVCDTGKTFVRGLSYLEELGAERKNIKTLSLHYKPHAEVKPDFYAAETSAWVIYPYEVRETIEELTPLWQKEGVSKEDMKKRYRAFEFSESSIAQFLI